MIDRAWMAAVTGYFAFRGRVGRSPARSNFYRDRTSNSVDSVRSDDGVAHSVERRRKEERKEEWRMKLTEFLRKEVKLISSYPFTCSYVFSVGLFVFIWTVVW